MSPSNVSGKGIGFLHRRVWGRMGRARRALISCTQLSIEPRSFCWALRGARWSLRRRGRKCVYSEASQAWSGLGHGRSPVLVKLRPRGLAVNNAQAQQEACLHRGGAPCRRRGRYHIFFSHSSVDKHLGYFQMCPNLSTYF